MAESPEDQDENVPAASKKKTAKKKSTRKKTSKKSTASTAGSDAGSEQSAAAESGVSDSSHDQAPNMPTQPQPVAPVGATASAGSGVAWIAIVLSLLAFAMGGWSWYQGVVKSQITSGTQQGRISEIEQRFQGFDARQSDVTSQINQVKSQLAIVEENVSNQLRVIRGELTDQDALTQKRLSGSEQQLASQADAFRQDFENLSDSIVKLRSELGRSLDSWTLEEVEQLIVIAIQRLHFAGEVELAKQALLLADDRLRALGNPSLGDARKALASEIAALEAVEQFDIGGLLNDISVLAESVSGLPLRGDITIPEKTSVSSQPDASGTREGEAQEDATGIDQYTQPIVDAGADFFASLGDLIQVEKNGEPVRPVLSAEIRQMIYASTRMMLESAQLAASRQDANLYQSRMAGAGKWVEDTFDTDAESTQRWLKDLSDTAQVVPEQNLPEVSGSLEAIRTAIQASE